MMHNIIRISAVFSMMFLFCIHASADDNDSGLSEDMRTFYYDGYIDYEGFRFYLAVTDEVNYKGQALMEKNDVEINPSRGGGLRRTILGPGNWITYLKEVRGELTTRIYYHGGIAFNTGWMVQSRINLQPVRRTPKIEDDKVYSFDLVVIGNEAYMDTDIEGELTIPETVVAIWPQAFQGCSNLTSLIIPDNVKFLGGAAFAKCTSLTDIQIGTGIDTIPNQCFYKCSALKTLSIPNWTKVIERMAFGKCSSLETVNMGTGVTTMGPSVFIDCTELSSITLSSSLSSIDEYAFLGCGKLKSITLPSSLRNWPDNMIAETDFEEIIFEPDFPLEVVKNSMFEMCTKLKRIVLPKSVKTIGSCAFYQCEALESFDMPDSVTTIAKNAFSGCNVLKNIKISAGLENIPKGLFTNMTSLEMVTFGENSKLKSIDEDAFYYCTSLTSIQLPESLESIGAGAFGYCNLHEFDMPDNVISIGTDFLDNNKNLETLKFSSGLTSIGNTYPSEYYMLKSLKKVSFGKNSKLETIGDYTFEHCENLEEFEMPDGVKSIGYNAFAYCESLKSITLPSTLNSIGASAFEGDVGLTDVYANMSNPFTINDNTFYDYPQSPYERIRLHVPAGTKSLYQSVDGWKKFNIIDDGKADVVLNKSIETFAYGVALDFTTPINGLNAYVVSDVKNGMAILTEVRSKVPAGIGLILKGTAGQSYEIPSVSSDVANISNMLVGAIYNTSIGGNDFDYILQDGKFVKANAGTINAGKAYLKLDAALARQVIEMDFESETTGIGDYSIDRKTNVRDVYNLNGQRIKHPTKGLYIMNGKKVFVK